MTGITQFNPDFRYLWLLVFINSCCHEASNLQRQLSPAERVYPVVSVTAVQELAARSSWRSVRALKPERAKQWPEIGHFTLC